MEFAKKLGPWMPLLIAAGYFVFLVATYVRMTAELKTSLAATHVEVKEKDE